MTEHPTREQLLALEPGEELHHDGMRAYRPARDPRYRLSKSLENVIYFSKRYLEDKLTYCASREFVQDMLPEPWGLISGELDRHAAEQHAHHLDGTEVATL